MTNCITDTIGVDLGDRYSAYCVIDQVSIPKNKLRMALARRLLVGVYVLLSRGEAFSLEKCLAVQEA